MIYLFRSKQKIETQTFAYAFNFFLPTALLIFLSLNGEYNLSAELGLTISINYLLTQIFSSNARSILISIKNKDKAVNEVLNFRIFISIILILLTCLIQWKINFTNKLLLLSISFIIILQWIIEIILLKNEIKKNINFFNLYILITLSGIVLFLFSYYFLNKFSANILLIYNFYLLSIILGNIITNNFGRYKRKIKLNFFIKNLKTISFLSSFFTQFTNLIWRIMIIFFCGKVIAGIYFSSFAIGSLPSTIFNISFGPIILKKKVQFSNLFKHLLKAYVLFSFFLLFLAILKNTYSDHNLTDFHFLSVSICMVASILMIKGTSDRQNYIQNSNVKNFVFKLDVYYNLSLLLVVPVLFYLGGTSFVMLSFLIASILSYCFYSLYLNKKIKLNDFKKNS